MAHLLYDCEYLFDVESINPCVIYELSIGDEVLDGNFLSIKWMATNNLISEQHILFAVENGHLKCLQYLHNTCNISEEWDIAICFMAAMNGQLECLKYLHEQGYEWNATICFAAVMNGHLECLQYLLEQGCGRSFQTYIGAAMNGHLNCIKYLHKYGCQWNWLSSSTAAEYNHLDCLQYMIENGCPWSRSCRRELMNPDILAYLKEKHLI